MCGVVGVSSLQKIQSVYLFIKCMVIRSARYRPPLRVFTSCLCRRHIFQFFFHCSGYESLYEHVPPEALPREYGGKLESIAELTGECNGMQANSNW